MPAQKPKAQLPRLSVVMRATAWVVASAFWTCPYAVGTIDEITWDRSTVAGYESGDSIWFTKDFGLVAFGTGAGPTFFEWVASCTAWFGGNATKAATERVFLLITVSGPQTAVLVQPIQAGTGDFTTAAAPGGATPVNASIGSGILDINGLAFATPNVCPAPRLLPI